MDREDAIKRLLSFRELDDGWYDGENKAPDKDFIDWVSRIICKWIDNHISIPYLYPTPDKGIIAEWSIINGWLVSAEFYESRSDVEFVAVKVGIEDAETCDLVVDCNDTNEIESIVKFFDNL